MYALTLETHWTGSQMAKTNYSYEKRQKEIAKKKKQEEKRLRKLAPQAEQPQEETNQPAVNEKLPDQA